jgi:hypothetical protein
MKTVMDLAEYFPGGGTDFQRPLNTALECLRQAKYKKAISFHHRRRMPGESRLGGAVSQGERKTRLLAVFDSDRCRSQLIGNSERIQGPHHNHQATDGGRSKGFLREPLVRLRCGFSGLLPRPLSLVIAAVTRSSSL